MPKVYVWVTVFLYSSHLEIGLDAGEVAGFTLKLDDDLGDLLLGKLSQEHISDPDLCDILANTALDPNKMNRLKNQKLLLITSVIYSERFEVQGERKHKVDSQLSATFIYFLLTSYSP